MSIHPKPNEITTKWSKEDNCYLAGCVDYPEVVGIGETPEIAINLYNELLKDWLDDKDPVIRNRGGRPKKNNTKIMYNVSFDVKAFIEMEAIRLDLNQGAVLEKIIKFYQKANKEGLSRHYSF